MELARERMMLAEGGGEVEEEKEEGEKDEMTTGE